MINVIKLSDLIACCLVVHRSVDPLHFVRDRVTCSFSGVGRRANSSMFTTNGQQPKLSLAQLNYLGRLAKDALPDACLHKKIVHL